VIHQCVRRGWTNIPVLATADQAVAEEVYRQVQAASVGTTHKASYLDTEDGYMVLLRIDPDRCYPQSF
jgi:hypothetical protein